MTTTKTDHPFELWLSQSDGPPTAAELREITRLDEQNPILLKTYLWNWQNNVTANEQLIGQLYQSQPPRPLSDDELTIALLRLNQCALAWSMAITAAVRDAAESLSSTS